VVHLGEAPVSRALGSWIDTSDVERLVIGTGLMSEPFNQAAQYLVGDAGWTLQALAERLSAPDGSAEEGWLRSVAEASATAGEAVETLLAASPAETLPQGKAVRLAVQAVPAGGFLMVGNSMPVRDVDLYCRASARCVQVLSQRGASGIDGLISGAIGAVSATGRPTVLVLGDVSFQHDIGGLALEPAATLAKAPLAIVVLQNGGGRLFELLPVHDLNDIDATFERYFLTPAKLSVLESSRAFGVQAARVTEPGALAEALARAMADPGVTVIEAVVDGAAAAGAIGQIAATVDRTLGGRAGS
jgi:2-succinyl-5-enolpyruvyl-6-hydroxy-3-cyclohexene-1-carboxylate synthase